MSHDGEPHESFEGVPTVATECNHNMDDRTSWEQAQERLGDRSVQPSVVAGLDHCRADVGASADEPSAVDCLREEPCEVDAKGKRELERAIWNACWGLMITFDEAKAAIEKYCK